MAKNIVPKRIPSQNIVEQITPVIDPNDPMRIFLNDSKFFFRSGGSSASYQKYLTSPASAYAVVSSAADSSVGEETIPRISASLGLSSIENITSEVYFDSLGNPKVKYILKIRNLGIDKQNVVGVDARIYNPFA
jgi:hypothetical protein